MKVITNGNIYRYYDASLITKEEYKIIENNNEVVKEVV